VVILTILEHSLPVGGHQIMQLHFFIVCVGRTAGPGAEKTKDDVVLIYISILITVGRTSEQEPTPACSLTTFNLLIFVL